MSERMLIGLTEFEYWGCYVPAEADEDEPDEMWCEVPDGFRSRFEAVRSEWHEVQEIASEAWNASCVADQGVRK